ncbi:MAG: hypothetical protein II972_03030 [Elusimicrobiaceae bacterium]|nr:hypothetical protein [Elusimicrobiaceae bacterium]
MKRILTLAVMLFTLVPLNALNLTEVLEDKNLSKQVNSVLQEALQYNNTGYDIIGLLYAGPATLKNGAKKLNLYNLTLTQEQGYISYKLTTDKNFDSFSLEVVGPEEITPDPHRTNYYYIILRLFKDKKLVIEKGLEAIELQNAGLNEEGIFNTKYAVNAVYKKGQSYILDQEPNTCGKRILIGTEKEIKTTYQTHSVKDHSPDCLDHNHCDCPVKTTITSTAVYPQEKSFIFKTNQCIKDSSCACPKYVMYI